MLEGAHLIGAPVDAEARASLVGGHDLDEQVGVGDDEYGEGQYVDDGQVEPEVHDPVEDGMLADARVGEIAVGVGELEPVGYAVDAAHHVDGEDVEARAATLALALPARVVLRRREVDAHELVGRHAHGEEYAHHLERVDDRIEVRIEERDDLEQARVVVEGRELVGNRVDEQAEQGEEAADALRCQEDVRRDAHLGVVEHRERDQIAHDADRYDEQRYPRESQPNGVVEPEVLEADGGRLIVAAAAAATASSDRSSAGRHCLALVHLVL